MFSCSLSGEDGGDWKEYCRRKKKDGVPHAPLLLSPSPPSPRHRSCQSDEHQVTQSLWAAILLVHYHGQNGSAAEDP
ncbi:uncharacterized protein LOC115174356 isoform X3 [Salmo trutta]|uniref:uncharacterized protein LOC115174356 isoform X3 n=1 Tax=Salmo trutta TaxID=8032 RepID=UPI0011322650|nr:uncharacterized protein LOC115174356 isoform X3 [Salmo trutta]